MKKSGNWVSEISAARIEEILNTLEMLAKGLDINSSAYEDVNFAAQAVMFAFSRAVRDEFSEFCKSDNLTEKQRKHLRAMGLEPDG